MNEIDLIEKDSLQKIPSFKAGDTVSVYYKIKEGQKERIQIFEGLVISRKGTSIKETFTVRKISYGVGTERIFPIHSKQIEKIKVLRKGKVRRAKLYYIRGLSKKASRIKESNK
ncbi:MAG: 50S ribosomal protein L19 [Deltaproteobacteria bacterium TMED126]|jgi:large subunit ribosomal protein L19|nr:50S ribosomal protein L19 [Candidatus Dadabacteria bacterium]NSW97855.1 50S ribosomal protein L19 [Deltaproteobacteria bacterium TMED126]|tara:strand:+ start:2138 stop:2479 length:342 start_codon:yes stop_codon:yes gene_type:complete